MPLFAKQISAVRQFRSWLFAENGFYAKLLGAAFVGVLAIAALTVFFIFLAFREHSYDQLRTHTLETLRSANKIENDIANMEADHRGFLFTGQEVYKEPFDRRKALIDSRLNELTVLVAGDASQGKRVSLVRSAVGQWLQQVALPEIQQRNSAKPAASVPPSALGKSLIDEARKNLQDVQTGAQVTLNEQTQGRQSNLSFEVLVSIPKLESVVSDMEKAEWGYLLTGDNNSLNAYRRAQEDFYAYHGHLTLLEAGNTKQLAILAKIREGLERWETQVAAPEMQAKQEGRDATAMVEHGHGKDIMDGLTSDINELEQNEFTVYDSIDFQTQF
jgi:CHASE3 domain sensor protein